MTKVTGLESKPRPLWSGMDYYLFLKEYIINYNLPDDLTYLESQPDGQVTKQLNLFKNKTIDCCVCSTIKVRDSR